MRTRSNLCWIAFIGFLLLFPVVFSSQAYLNNIIEILILALFGVSLNLLVGYTGLLSLGHCAFFAIGSYSAGILLQRTSLSVPSVFFSGMVLSGIAALVMGYFCTRLTRFYFSFLTLAFSQIIYVIVMKWVSVTGGGQGLIGGIPKPAFHILGWVVDVAPRLNFYYFTVLVTCGSFILCKVIIDSPFGWILRCVRENSLRAQFIGINIRRYQLIIFVVAGIFGALAGGLTALNISGCYPDHAYWMKGADPIFVILIGGMNSFVGPIVGSAVFIFLSTWITPHTRFLGLFLGAILVFISVFARMGIVDFLILKKDIWREAVGWGKSKKSLTAKMARTGVHR